MEDRSRPDFKQYSLPPFSRKFLLRILFYVLVLSLIAYVALSTEGKHRKMDPETIQEINGVELEMSDSLVVH